jgi:hypothetical protein
MLHPEVLRQLAKDRQQMFEQEAKRDRLARDLSSPIRDERHDRFDVRNLRWLLFRPTGA